MNKKLTKIELKSKIELLQKELTNRIDSLNSGGCGVFAFYMSQALNTMDIEHEIISDFGYKITTKSYKDQIKQFNESLEELDYTDYENSNYRGFTASHICIKIRGLVFDGYRFIEKEEYSNWYRKGVGYDLELLYKSIKPQNGWNTWYNREQTPLLVDIINKNFLKKDLIDYTIA